MGLKKLVKGVGVALLVAFAACGSSSAYATEGAAATGEGSSETYYVWFDGTDGLKQLKPSMDAYYAGATDTCVTVTDGEVTLPTEAGTTTRYGYKLNGWYDVYNNKYYGSQYLGSKVSVTRNTVFYADWVATSYDLGTSSRATVTDQPDTSSFITNDVFDYNELFNLRSAAINTDKSTLNGSASHTEWWSLVRSGTASLQSTLYFSFLNWAYDDLGGHVTLASLDGFKKDAVNDSKSNITQGIITDASGNVSDSGKSILDALFSKTSEVGRTYLGEGDGLYQYVDDSSDENYGYYYYDSAKNGASYNQSQQSFVLYQDPEYIEEQKLNSNKTQWVYKTEADKGTPVETTGFLPFNDNESGKYDEKDGDINYWFGLQSTIDFWLPNNPGTGGNIADTGKQMEFRFSGDDDVWVFVDDVLVLDLGGIHGARSGRINFSTGEVTTEVTKDVNTTTTLPSSITSGNHKLKVCYLERGSSQSNCSIYFNIAPKYALSITKKDADDSTKALEGARFGVYTDKACTVPAQLWNNVDETGSAANEFVTGSNGVATCYGLVAGNTYYVKELEAPEGYEIVSTDPICITISADGKVTADDGADFREDKANRMYYLTVTNKKETVPDVPDTPDDDNPDTPDDDTPDDDNPDTPDTPDTPETPETPSEPSGDKPAKPKNTDGTIPATGDSAGMAVACLLTLAVFCLVLGKRWARNK